VRNDLLLAQKDKNTPVKSSSNLACKRGILYVIMLALQLLFDRQIRPLPQKRTCQSFVVGRRLFDAGRSAVQLQSDGGRIEV